MVRRAIERLSAVHLEPIAVGHGDDDQAAINGEGCQALKHSDRIGDVFEYLERRDDVSLR